MARRTPRPRGRPHERAADGLEAPDSAAVERLVAVLTSAARARAVVDLYPTCHGLARAGPEELQRVAGLTAIQAARLVAAAEIGRRALRPPWDDHEPFCDPEAVWRHYRGELGGLAHERLIAVALDAKCRRIREVRLAEGMPTRCLVEPGQVFRPMLRAGAVSALLVHNHPSGDPAPSAPDLTFTRRIAAAGQLLGISLSDHVIVGRRGYHSMATEGLLP